MALKAKRNRRHSVILAVLIGALVCYFIATFIGLQMKVKAQTNVVSELEETYQQQLEENELLAQIIENGEEASYMEKVAREQHDYAKPEERVYFDSTLS